MGADMILCCVPACDLTPPRIERIEQLLQAIPEDDEDLHHLMEMLGYEEADLAKQRVLENCVDSQQPSRQITTNGLPGLPYRIRFTGGLSWGDVPTEAFTVLEHVERCPQAWQILEEFAREDFSAERASTQLKSDFITLMRSQAARRKLDVSSEGISLDFSHELPSAYEGSVCVYQARVAKVEGDQLVVVAEAEGCETTFGELDLLALSVETLELLAEAVRTAANEPP